MCLMAALVGVVVFLRKQSLLGESLSHAAYPGVILGIVVAALVGPDGQDSNWVATFVMSGAFVAALLGLWVINLLQRYLRIHSDSALCLVLSSFFGMGLTLASRVQVTHTNLYQQIQMYLYGQAATMTDQHIWLYGFLSLFAIAVVAFLYKELQVMNFDPDYARSLGIKTRMVDSLFFSLTVLAIVIGIRSVGVVLMSAMLIAPAAAARQYTHRLSTMLGIAAMFGVLSGFLGNYLSVEVSDALLRGHPGRWLVLPTGPMIVLVSSFLCLFSLLLAPERGLILRMIRVMRFRFRCLQENLLKAIWRVGPQAHVTLKEVCRCQTTNRIVIWVVLKRLIADGWVEAEQKGRYFLTQDGQQRAAHVVRLHRLWEVYLADYLGVGAERVHPNAEEMEHIITPDIERELTDLLHDPKRDPHRQPIPPAKKGL